VFGFVSPKEGTIGEPVLEGRAGARAGKGSYREPKLVGKKLGGSKAKAEGELAISPPRGGLLN